MVLPGHGGGQPLIRAQELSLARCLCVPGNGCVPPLRSLPKAGRGACYCDLLVRDERTMGQGDRGMPQVAHGNPRLQPRILTSDTAKIQSLKTYARSLSTTVSADRFTGTSPHPNWAGATNDHSRHAVSFKRWRPADLASLQGL